MARTRTTRRARPARRAASVAPASSPSYPRSLVATQLARVRALCGELPDTVERSSHGSPGFFTGGKAFAYFLDNHHGDGRLALWCAAPDGAQAMLVDSNPDHYFLPPYVAHMGWIGVRLDRDAAWSEIAAVFEAAHQTRQRSSHRAPRTRATAPPARRTAKRR